MTMWCPACGAEYRDGVWACADDGTMLVADKPEEPAAAPRGAPTHSHDEIRTARLGRFDPLQIPIILQLLEQEGIFAMTQIPFDEPAVSDSYGFSTGADVIMVEAACLETARSLVKERLPTILQEMQAELEREFGDTE